MHVPCFQCGQNERRANAFSWQFDALRRSLDELMPELERAQVPLALENMWGDDWKLLNALLDAYPPELIGITYDSGHGNSDCLRQLELLDAARERLTALHLHDNDGSSDLHQPPFYGTVDWERLAEILAASPYPRELSFELAMRNTPYFDKGRQEATPEAIRAFLGNAMLCCERFAELAEKKRSREPGRHCRCEHLTALMTRNISRPSGEFQFPAEKRGTPVFSGHFATIRPKKSGSSGETTIGPVISRRS